MLNTSFFLSVVVIVQLINIKGGKAVSISLSLIIIIRSSRKKDEYKTHKV